MEEQDKSTLARELMLGFHTQFAENQRSREQSFLRILAFLAIPLVGYAYAYQYYFHHSREFPVGLTEFCYVQVIASLLISAGTWTIVIIANNFRRDQYVNARIREAAGVLGDGKVFPYKYDPKESFKEKALFKWMPDFLFAFYVLFMSVQAVLLYIFYNAVEPVSIVFGTRMNWTHTFAFVIPCILFLTCLLLLPWYYRSEVIRVMGVDKREYEVLRAWKRCLNKTFRSIRITV